MSSFDRKIRFQGKLPAIDFIKEGIEYTQQRMDALGVEDSLLLDPDDAMENQVAVLRCSFLQAERSALPFSPKDDNFWRIIRARLQPVVLAYSTHEKFVQSLDSDVQDRKANALMQIYRDRLDNSERFRKFFFELNEKITREVDSIRMDERDMGDSSSHYDGRNDVANIQANVISQLENTIKEYDKREKGYIKTIKDKNEEGSPTDKLEEEIRSLKKSLEKSSEENLQLKIALDAAQQSQSVSSGSTPANDQSNDSVNNQSSNQSDVEFLKLKVSGLERELESTSDAAYNAFMSNSDLGIVILFMLMGFRCETEKQLGDEVVKSVTTYGVIPTIRIKVGREFEYFNLGNRRSDVAEKFASMEGKGRVASNKKDYFIYEDECALMVENMPINDLEKCGRLKDNLGTLMQGVAASLNLIILSDASDRQQKQMEQLILRSNDVFTKLDKNLDKNKAISTRILQNFGVELRTVLGVAPGDQKSIKLSGSMKKVEDAMTILMNKDELVDPNFVRNIKRVASTIKK